MPDAKYPGFEIEEDFSFQRKMWVAERIAWASGVLILVAAVAGLFGSGPLNRVTAGEKDAAFWLDYGRFARYHASTDLHLNSGEGTTGTVEIFVSESYLDNVRIERISPEPESIESLEGGQVFVFTSGGGFSATLTVRPQEIGSLSGTIGLVDGEQVDFEQFVYP